MPEHETPLIATIAAGLVFAFTFGLAANRLRVSPLIGYLLAGILVGPFRGRLRIRVKSGHKAGVGPARIRLVISPTTPRLALPATFL